MRSLSFTANITVLLIKCTNELKMATNNNKRSNKGIIKFERELPHIIDRINPKHFTELSGNLPNFPG